MIPADIAAHLWLALGLGLVAILAVTDFLSQEAASRPDRRVSRPFDRTAWFALAVWLAASQLALWGYAMRTLVVLTVGGLGGLAFGWVSARRVDARRVKIRTRRKRQRVVGETTESE